MVERLLGKITNLFGEVSSLPNHLVKEWLATVVGKVVVNMETKDIEIHLALPTAMLESGFSGENPMRLVTTSASPSSYETHQQAIAIAAIRCQFHKNSNTLCYHCQRSLAA